MTGRHDGWHVTECLGEASIDGVHFDTMIDDCREVLTFQKHDDSNITIELRDGNLVK